MLTDAEKQMSSTRLEKLKILPRDRVEIRALTARADRIFASLLGEERAQLGAIMDEFERVLDRQDPLEIERRRKEFAAVLDQLDKDIWS